MLQNPEKRDQKSITEKQLYNAIIAKMSNRSTNIEETVRQGDVLRPYDRVKNIPPRKKDNYYPEKFEQSLASANINQDMDTDYDILTENNKKTVSVMLKETKTHSKKSRVEIEASFGSFGNAGNNKFAKFFPGVKSHSDFIKLKEFLTLSKDPAFKTVEIEDEPAPVVVISHIFNFHL